MRGVLGSRNAAIQNGVVARMLTLLPKATTDDPQQRIEPKHGPKDFHYKLNQPVSSPDMGELVTENDANTLFRPLPRTGRDDDARTEQAPCRQN
jgi:hypothetical protein